MKMNQFFNIKSILVFCIYTFSFIFSEKRPFFGGGVGISRGGSLGYNLFCEWGEYNDWVIGKKNYKDHKTNRKFLIIGRSSQGERTDKNTYDLGSNLTEYEGFHRLRIQNEETFFTFGLLGPPPPFPIDFYIGFGLNHSREYFIRENDNETFSEILGGGGPYFIKNHNLVSLRPIVTFGLVYKSSVLWKVKKIGIMFNGTSSYFPRDFETTIGFVTTFISLSTNFVVIW